MFGQKRHLQKKLAGHGGKRATAEVTAATRGHIISTPQLGEAMSVINWKVSVVVHPDDEPPFPATFEMAMGVASEAYVGLRINVIYDADDHTKIARDESPEGFAAGMAEKLSGSGRGDKAALTAILESATAHPGQGIDQAALIEAMHLPPTARVFARGEGQIAGPGTEHADPVDQLAKLADLRDRGVLTPEEFASQKARLLGES